jgi:hypothetical protein
LLAVGFLLDVDIRVLLLLVSCCGCDKYNKTLATTGAPGPIWTGKKISPPPGLDSRTVRYDGQLKISTLMFYFLPHNHIELLNHCNKILKTFIFCDFRWKLPKFTLNVRDKWKCMWFLFLFITISLSN